MPWISPLSLVRNEGDEDARPTVVELRAKVDGACEAALDRVRELASTEGELSLRGRAPVSWTPRNSPWTG